MDAWNSTFVLRTASITMRTYVVPNLAPLGALLGGGFRTNANVSMSHGCDIAPECQVLVEEWCAAYDENPGSIAYKPQCFFKDMRSRVPMTLTQSLKDRLPTDQWYQKHVAELNNHLGMEDNDETKKIAFLNRAADAYRSFGLTLNAVKKDV